MLVPLGGSLALNFCCTPKAWFMEPASRLNFNTSISENESNKTKKHMSSDIRSANVMTQAGKPESSSPPLHLRVVHRLLLLGALGLWKIGFQHGIDDPRILATLNRHERVDYHRFYPPFFFAPQFELVGNG